MSIIARPDNAALALEGKLLKGKWNVLRRIDTPPGSTGGFFSIGYVVHDGEREAFLKALNFHAFFALFPGKRVVEILAERTKAFEYERTLLLRVKDHRLSKVSQLLDEGEEIVMGFTIPQVPYLIFEIAEGDIRSTIRFAGEIDLAWKLKSLHDVAVGLQQLYGIKVGHNDLKPSNVLLYESGFVSKLGDLGRSLCSDIVAPHEDGSFPGDFTYAPPEFLYRFSIPDLSIRMKATDVYLFGSLLVFYFTGTTMNALLFKNMNEHFRWDRWSGGFDPIKGYLIDGFYKALQEFQSHFSDIKFGEKLVEMVRYCCWPIPEQRGHPKGLQQLGEQYGFHRMISQLDLLSKKAEIRFR